MGITPTSVAIKVNPKVGIGFGTVSGMLLAIGQYLGAIGLMLAGDLTAESIGAMGTATLTLVTVLIGRYKQASEAIKSVSAERAAIAASPPPPWQTGTLETHDPESNVLYLDGKLIAEAVVKAINTKALVAAMAAGATHEVTKEPPASAPASTEGENS
jgi:hypothetical protein